MSIDTDPATTWKTLAKRWWQSVAHSPKFYAAALITNFVALLTLLLTDLQPTVFPRAVQLTIHAVTVVGAAWMLAQGLWGDGE